MTPFRLSPSYGALPCLSVAFTHRQVRGTTPRRFDVHQPVRGQFPRPHGGRFQSVSVSQSQRRLPVGACAPFRGGESPYL